MKKEATFYDYARFCKSQDNCRNCLLADEHNAKDILCNEFIQSFPDEANEIILKWIEENPKKTRQSEFLKMFPNAEVDNKGIIGIAPCRIDTEISKRGCLNCEYRVDKNYEEFWTEEI